MKFLFYSIFSLLIIGTIGITIDVFAAESNQICIDKVRIENSKGKIACVTPSTANTLVERGWVQC